MSPSFFVFLAIISSFALASLSPHASAGESQPRVGSYQHEFLQAHNEARAAAGVPPLLWNYTLELDSRRYANKLRNWCSTNPLYKWGTDGVYGRNLFKGGRRTDILRIPAEAVAYWVSERRWYHRRNNACDGHSCGEYTQVVWRATTQVGCSRRRCPGSLMHNTVAVCEYYPPGNVEGQRPY